MQDAFGDAARELRCRALQSGCRRRLIARGDRFLNTADMRTNTAAARSVDGGKPFDLADHLLCRARIGHGILVFRSGSCCGREPLIAGLNDGVNSEPAWELN